MQFLINDRILFRGQPLKAMAVAPQLAKQGAFPGDLGVRFSVFRQSERVPVAQIKAFGFPVEKPVSSQLENAFEDEQMRGLRGFPPFTTTRLDTENVEPGNYSIAAHVASDSVGRRSFVVMDEKAEANFLNVITEESFRRKESFKDPTQVQETWRSAWRDLFLYLSVSPPNHVRWNVQEFKIADALLEQLIPDMLDWTTFHISRFVFDELFYGGIATIALGENENFPEFIVKVRKFAGQLRKELPNQLRVILDSTQLDDVRLELSWVPQGTEGELTLTWRR